MSISSSSAISTVASDGASRWLIRRTAGGSAFWGAGLPALGLAALTWWATLPFARDDVEASVRHGVRASLDAASLGWVGAVVSGQHVVLRGTPPDDAAADRALATARAATCPTWTGPRTCAVEVIGAFGAPLPAAPGPSGAAAPVADPPVPASPSSAGPPQAASFSATEAAPARACEEALARELETDRIEFGSGSASLSPRSAGLLDRLAGAARGCPGRLVIEGHTDDVGAAAANRALSQARAAAVRTALVQRGLEASRLEARGLGPTRPRAPNDTPEGRAVNRRIEFHATPSP